MVHSKGGKIRSRKAVDALYEVNPDAAIVAAQKTALYEAAVEDGVIVSVPTGKPVVLADLPIPEYAHPAVAEPDDNSDSPSDSDQADSDDDIECETDNESTVCDNGTAVAGLVAPGALQTATTASDSVAAVVDKGAPAVTVSDGTNTATDATTGTATVAPVRSTTVSTVALREPTTTAGAENSDVEGPMRLLAATAVKAGAVVYTTGTTASESDFFQYQ
jgi:hypothetical protein